jgi:hypothetical protein
MMMVSSLKGRLRLRGRRLKNAATATRAGTALENLPGVTRVTLNQVTGSLLLEYDPTRLDPTMALKLLAELAPEPERETAAPGSLDRAFQLTPEAAELLTLTGTFIVCVASSALRARKLHLYSGLSLAMLAARHIFKYRRRLGLTLTPDH